MIQRRLVKAKYLRLYQKSIFQVIARNPDGYRENEAIP